MSKGRKGHISGKRAQGTHTTLSEPAERVVKALLGSHCPDKGIRIETCPITKGGGGGMRVTVKDLTVGSTYVGVKVTVVGGKSAQGLILRNCSKPEAIKDFLANEFPN
jgi:hypothetical protein